MVTTCFDSENFSCAEDYLIIRHTYTMITPFLETLEGALVKIWSIKVEVLQVTRVRDCISCFKPCIVQNW